MLGDPSRKNLDSRLIKMTFDLTILTWLVIALLALSAAQLLILWLSRGSRDASERAVREELRAGRGESARAARELRGEVTGQLKDLTESNTKLIDKLRETVEARLKFLQEGNEKKLEEMRRTVDEKLHETLEKRLGEKFQLVSKHLEAVNRGLGEMQSLAAGVGDLKRVLTNVKTRGTWAEIQLGAILEQILTPDQFDRNVKTKADSRENVEYAVRLPGPDGVGGECVWLPIDSKFPQEDYQRLLDATEAADADALQKSTAALVRAVRSSAKEIETKYLNPPKTTDFALMFLPTEGLYSEILRQPGMVEELLHEYRVVISGPTTLAAILSSLRMGFRTLAIEERTSEVREVLAAVKTEFGKFSDTLKKVKRQLDLAGKTIDDTGVRTRQMARKLKEIEQLPTDRAETVLGLAVGEEIEISEEETVEEEAQTDE